MSSRACRYIRSEFTARSLRFLLADTRRHTSPSRSPHDGDTSTAEEFNIDAKVEPYPSTGPFATTQRAGAWFIEPFNDAGFVATNPVTTRSLAGCCCMNGWRGGHQPRTNSSGALMRARMHANECHASALPTYMRPKKLSARLGLPHVHMRDVER